MPSDKLLAGSVNSARFPVNAVVHVVANREVELAQANAPGNVSGIIGIALGVEFVFSGVQRVRLEAGLTPAAGDTLYVSATQPGFATNVAPGLVAPIGVIYDASLYDNLGLVEVTLTLQGAGTVSAAACSADWDIDTVRYYAVDAENGDDNNLGYNDGSMTAAGAVALASLDRLTEIVPKFGCGRAFVIALRGNGVVNDGDLDVFDNLMGYRYAAVRATADFSNTVADRIVCGAVVATGTNAAGYTILRYDDTIASTAGAVGAPIDVTTGGAHGRVDGDLVFIDLGTMAGMPEAEGLWEVEVLSPTSLRLNGSIRRNTYTSPGSGLIKSYTLTAVGGGALLPNEPAALGKRLRDTVTNFCTAIYANSNTASTSAGRSFMPELNFIPTANVHLVEQEGAIINGRITARSTGLNRIDTPVQFIGVRSQLPNPITLDDQVLVEGQSDVAFIFAGALGGYTANLVGGRVADSGTYVDEEGVARTVGVGLRVTRCFKHTGGSHEWRNSYLAVALGDGTLSFVDKADVVSLLSGAVYDANTIGAGFIANQGRIGDTFPFDPTQTPLRSGIAFRLGATSTLIANTTNGTIGCVLVQGPFRAATVLGAFDFNRTSGPWRIGAVKASSDVSGILRPIQAIGLVGETSLLFELVTSVDRVPSCTAENGIGQVTLGTNPVTYAEIGMSEVVDSDGNRAFMPGATTNDNPILIGDLVHSMDADEDIGHYRVVRLSAGIGSNYVVAQADSAENASDIIGVTQVATFAALNLQPLVVDGPTWIISDVDEEIGSTVAYLSDTDPGAITNVPPAIPVPVGRILRTDVAPSTGEEISLVDFDIDITAGIEALSGMASFAAPPPATSNPNAIGGAVVIANGAIALGGNTTDYPRKLVFTVVDNGDINAGAVVTAVGTDQDGQPITQIIPLPGTGGKITLRAYALLASATVSGVIGGPLTSTIAVGTTDALGITTKPGATNFEVFKELDLIGPVAVGTVDAAARTIEPTSTPDGNTPYVFWWTASA